MTRSQTIRLTWLAGCSMAVASPALAQSVARTVPETLSLTPEEKADIVEHQTEASVDAARAGLAGGGSGQKIHGEIGTSIGNHGMRDVYGTAAIPLGDHAGAIVSFEDGRYGTHR